MHYIRQLATLESAAGGEKQQQQAGHGRGLLLFPHAELDVVVTPEEGGRDGESGRRGRVEAASP